AQRQSDLKIAANTPIILRIKTQTIHCYRLRQAHGKLLHVARAVAGEKVEQIFALAKSDRSPAGREIGYVIAMKVHTKLQRVISFHLGEIVHDPILTYISTLRPDIEIASQGEEGIAAEGKTERHELCRRSQIL